MVTILETLADYGRITHDTDLLTEYVRQKLSGILQTSMLKKEIN